MFFLGVFLVLVGLNTKNPFDAVDSFEIGSFALVIATFLMTKGITGKYYFRMLFHSVTATLLFFLSGAFLAFTEELSTTSSPTWTIPLEFQALGAFFLVGAMDLLLVAIFLLFDVNEQYEANLAAKKSDPGTRTD